MGVRLPPGLAIPGHPRGSHRHYDGENQFASAGVENCAFPLIGVAFEYAQLFD
jgi:hypothetical protein